MGDHLIQFHDIANYLADAVSGLTREAAQRRFLFSVMNGAFGRHGARRTIANLIDLDSYSSFAPGCYSLRPSYVTVEARSEYMRARRSIWAQWIEAQGWPVPPELKTSVLIDATAETRAQAVLIVGRRRPRGNPGKGVTERVKQQMRAMAPNDLRAMKGVEMEARFKASRDTCSKARDAVLAEIAGK